MSDKSDELAGQQSQTASLLAVWRSFTEHPGWELYRKLLQEQADSRRGDVLLRPLAKMDDALGQEYMKGEISGLLLAQVSPYSVLETLKAQLKTIEVKLEREDEIAEKRADARSRVDDEQFSSS